MKLYDLSRLLLPSNEYLNATSLFLNRATTVSINEKKTCNLNIYRFNTWMNMFASKKTYFYCDIKEIYLRLAIKGNYRVQVIGSNLDVAYDRFDTVLVDQYCTGNVTLHVPSAIDYEGLHFIIFEDTDNPILIEGGAWCTDTVPLRQTKLAIIICTFKREEYISKIIEKFNNFLIDNRDLKERLELIIVDNGNTLNVEELSSENIRVFSNINAGGAGGFARGLLEITEHDAGFTRALYMDDDVDIFPESFYRTMLLADFLKETYKDSFINGAMLSMFNKIKFFENLVIQNKLWIKGHQRNILLNDYNAILRINDIPVSIFAKPSEKVSTAWYYHCFSLNLVKDFPLPIFFRGDDVEHGWRYHGVHHISMNGINVWHNPFEWRVSKAANYYYQIRNMFYVNTLYTPNFKKNYKKYLIEKKKYILETYDYISADFLLRAMQDILKGPKVFEENPEQQFKEINELSKKIVYKDCFNASELNKAKKFKPKATLRKLIFKVTLSGSLFPTFLFSKMSLAVELFPSTNNFRLYKEVKVYNLLTKKYELRQYNRKKIHKYNRSFNTLLNKISKNYDSLAKDFSTMHKVYSSKEFWKKYLSL